jgi:hypothetical protein
MEKALSFRSETDAVEEVIGMGRSKDVLRIENAFLSKDWFHSSKIKKFVRRSYLLFGPTSQSTGGSSVFIEFDHCLQ